jgi:hypothetical protein
VDQQEFSQLLGNYGEFVGAIGVVVTLAYLAVQIKRNTLSARAQSRQTLLDVWSATNWTLANDPNLLRIYATALTRWPDLPNDEKTIFDIGMGRYLANLQNGVLLRAAGMLDDVTLGQTANFMLLCILSEGGAKWWQETPNAMPETRKYLEDRLAQSDNLPLPVGELFPWWMAMAEDPR